MIAEMDGKVSQHVCHSAANAQYTTIHHTMASTHAHCSHLHCVVPDDVVKLDVAVGQTQACRVRQCANKPEHDLPGQPLAQPPTSEKKVMQRVAVHVLHHHARDLLGLDDLWSVGHGQHLSPIEVKGYAMAHSPGTSVVWQRG